MSDIARVQDLLCDRALFGLEPEEERELAGLASELDVALGEELERAAAAIALAELRLEPMPAALFDRVVDEAKRAFAPPAEPQAPVVDLAAKRAERAAPPESTSKPRETEGSTSRVLPWAVAAAFALFALSGWWPRLFGQPEVAKSIPSATPSTSASAAPTATASAPPAKPDHASEREKLLAQAKDAKKVEWSATKDPGATGASGDVVWSTAEQRGYMRFRGLRPNDPTKTQYQLWIFDKERDAKYPVDGGVFDVDATTGDVIVPITPKIAAKSPTLFAITVEPPGGVVVSKREHIVLTAALGS